jgi:putative Mg2+ transporter-C (MgtC) family protein
MPAHTFQYLPVWMGNLHSLLPADVFGAVVTITAILCGAAIGFERERREKAAGIRTLVLVCLGACIYTLAGIMLAGDRSDPGRVAAQVVTGIGFLGAGAIIHGRGLVIGVTTAAAIWTVAAIGVVLGTGFVAAGVFFTLLVLATLTIERWCDHLIEGACDWTTLRIEFDPADGRTQAIIQGILDDHAIPDDRIRFRGADSVEISYCRRHRSHRSILPLLAALPAVRRFDLGTPDARTR